MFSVAMGGAAERRIRQHFELTVKTEPFSLVGP
jgi:hypothetical protein